MCLLIWRPGTAHECEESYSILGSVTETWVVKACETTETPNFTQVSKDVTITDLERSVMMRLNSARAADTLSRSQPFDVTPGDICTLLRSENDSVSCLPVLVHSYWKYVDGLPSIVLLWIEYDREIDPNDNRDLYVNRIMCAHDVRRVQQKDFGAEQRQASIAGSQCKPKPPFGTLGDGTPFVIYKILSYCDDFQKSSQMSKAGSAGGCYFLPLSLPVERRRTTSSVRIISLTPPGVSTNDVIHYIVPDLVHARTHGVHGHSPSGAKLRIFVDVLGFVADYPASASIVDVLGYVGRSPCTVCSFRRLQDTETEGSKFDYTTKVHSNNSSFLRHDHLLTGISKDILNATFRTVPTAESRAELGILICTALRTNGLLPQKEVFNGKSKTLHSMTLSEVFCVLAVAVPLMKTFIARYSHEHNKYECFNLLRQLQTLIAYTYWWPEKELDGFQSVEAVRRQKERYFSDLRKMSKRYVRTVDKICRNCPEVRQQADKPNLHRLVELYEHTFPTFGHVRETMELVFESAHQPLKRSINRKKGDKSHIFAVEQCVGNDWQGRLAALSRADLKANVEARRGIRRLLLGEEADLLHEGRHDEFTKKCDVLFAKLVTPTLQKRFRKSGMVANFCTSKDSHWKARTMVDIELVAETAQAEVRLLKRIVTLSKKWIKTLFPSFPEGGDQRDLAIHLFKYARRLKTTNSGTQLGKAYGNDTILTNCAVVIHTDPRKGKEKIVTASPHDAPTRPLFFAVVSILEKQGEEPWAIWVKCTKGGLFLQRSAPLSGDSFRLLRLSSNVRRAGI